jgi:hypothetical protein
MTNQLRDNPPTCAALAGKLYNPYHHHHHHHHCARVVIIQGKGDLSAYNPLDLFSREPVRVKRALVSLLATPNVSCGHGWMFKCMNG